MTGSKINFGIACYIDISRPIFYVVLLMKCTNILADGGKMEMYIPVEKNERSSLDHVTAEHIRSLLLSCSAHLGGMYSICRYLCDMY